MSDAPRATGPVDLTPRNEVRLVGRLGADPVRYDLPSGDAIVAFRVTVDHGRVFDPERPGGPRRLATLHPSAILRARTAEAGEEMRATLVADLTVAAGALGAAPARKSA